MGLGAHLPGGHFFWAVNFGELRKGEVRRTPQSGSRATAPRGTITPPIDQQEETKERGFLEEALTCPGG
jgi:hypothetical protein